MEEKKVSKKAQQRCEKLYKVGLEMFLQNGYDKTSLADVVKIAGGSLSTLYENYGDKEGFFEAIVLKKVEEYYGSLHEKIDIDKNLNLEDFLYKFGREYIDNFSNDDAIALGRIFYAEAHKDNGKLVKVFKEKIAKMSNQIFLDYFDTKDSKNILKFNDYDAIAEEFCLLIREPEFTNGLLNYNLTKLTSKQKDKKVRRVVDVFLNGYLKR